MPAWIRFPHRIINHIGIGVHAIRVALYRVGSGEAVAKGIIVASIIIQQAGHAVQTLAGEVVGGGHGSPTVFACAIGPVQLHGRDRAARVDGHVHTPKQVADQVDQRTRALLHRQALAAQTVVVQRRGRAAGDSGFGIPVEGDRIGDRRGPVHRAARAL